MYSSIFPSTTTAEIKVYDIPKSAIKTAKTEGTFVQFHILSILLFFALIREFTVRAEFVFNPTDKKVFIINYFILFYKIETHLV